MVDCLSSCFLFSDYFISAAAPRIPAAEQEKIRILFSSIAHLQERAGGGENGKSCREAENSASTPSTHFFFFSRFHCLKNGVRFQNFDSGFFTSIADSFGARFQLDAYHRTASFGDDVVIVAAYRTAICKAKRGGFKDTYADDLLAPILKALVEKTNVNPNEIGDIVVGTLLAPGSQRARECRMAAFYAGFPDTVPIRTVNRQCSSGLQAVADVAASIKAGFYDIGIGAGLESMTINQMGYSEQRNPKVESFPQAKDCLLPVGITSENVAEHYGITREEQDQAAVASHKKAAAATASGKFIDEIIHVDTKILDVKTGEEKHVTISVDDGIRPDTSLSVLANLKPAFKKGGTTTAGNSSQVSDGAAGVLLMRRSLAMQKGIPILGVFRSFSVVGVDPALLGISPAVAIPAAVKLAGLEINDIDLFEINEVTALGVHLAFSSQFVYCCKKLELDPEKGNVNGGAMALGHPLGATGARCVATLLHEMRRRGKDCRFGVVSMCIATGMGAAAVFESGDCVDDLRNAKQTPSQNFLSKDTIVYPSLTLSEKQRVGHNAVMHVVA
ncbi:3-ketoacyl-CoA thiolase 1, peroxisomal [Asimina triloba]